MPDCRCGSIAREGAPAYSILRMGDLGGPKVIRAWGIRFRIPISSNSPVFLASTDSFCKSPPSVSHGGGGAIDTLLNAAIDRLWNKNCRCRREVGVRDFRYAIIHKVMVAGDPIPQERVFNGNALVTEPVRSVNFLQEPGFGGFVYRPVLVFGEPPITSRLAGVLVFSFTEPRGKVLSFERVSFTCPQDENSTPRGVEPPPTPLPLPAPIISLPESPPGVQTPDDPTKIVSGYPDDDECCDCC